MDQFKKSRNLVITGTLAWQQCNGQICMCTLQRRSQFTAFFLPISTGCDSHFRNPVVFNILKEQKQTIHQQKAFNLSYLEPEGHGRGNLMRA